GALEQPGQRHLRDSRAMLLPALVEHFDQIIVALAHIALEISCAHAIRGYSAAVLAGQEAGLQRAGGDHPDALIQAERLILALEIGAPHQAIWRLQADEAMQV